MRSFSLFTIFLLCLAIILIDVLTFFWLQSITQLLTSVVLKRIITVLFWFFTLGLVTAIMTLKIKLDHIDPRRKQLLISSLYGLTVSSFIPKIIFVIIFSTLYFSNYVFSEKESLVLIPMVGMFSGFLPFFVIVYGIFRARYRFKVYHHVLKFEELPEEFNMLRIVQISDIHLGSFNFRYHILEKAIKIVNHIKPDLIFFTGDLVNNFAWELRGWEPVLGQLKAEIGKFAVLGNHDYGDYSQWVTAEEKELNADKIKDFFEKIDFKLLLNQAEIIEIKGDRLAVIGVENWGSPPFKQYADLQGSLNGAREIDFKILLSHDPSHWGMEVTENTDIAMTLSGHTHGMQAGIQLKNKNWSPIKYKYKHWAGLYKKGKQVLYVNRGLGWLGFPGRLGMRPEITFFELKRGN